MLGSILIGAFVVGIGPLSLLAHRDSRPLARRERGNFSSRPRR
jgi:hypothetical protein